MMILFNLLVKNLEIIHKYNYLFINFDKISVITYKLQNFMKNPLIDSFGRFHSYLRMSLTEKCNLRCKYCMPHDGVKLSEKNKLLTFEERKLVLSTFYSLGVNKIRFTGGEPTISNQLMDLVQYTRSLDDNITIAITTNGTMLNSTNLKSLVNNGLNSINISLDTLSSQKFASISRRSENLHKKVLSSIYNSLSLGIKVKINCVLMKGMNDDELIDFVNLTKDVNLHVRFIELMPFDGNEWSHDKYITYFEVLQRMKSLGLDLIKENSLLEDKHDTTKWYICNDHVGKIGFITSMSDQFCGKISVVIMNKSNNML